MIDHHPGDALSALLDGELPAGEAAEVRAHVAACGRCAGELEEIRGARRTLRELPAAEPPPGFLASLQPGSNVVPLHRHRRRMAGVNVAAAAAAAVAAIALLGAPSGEAIAVAAEPQGAADRHDATVSATSAGAGTGMVLPGRRVPPTTAPAQGLDRLPAGYVAPEELAGYRLVGAYQLPDGVHLLYEKGEHRLSVFEQEGDLGDLPPNLTRDGDVWRWDDPRVAGKVVVAEHDGMVITMVGDESADAVLEAMLAMPRSGHDTGEPLGRRLRRACDDVLEALSPAG